MSCVRRGLSGRPLHSFGLRIYEDSLYLWKGVAKRFSGQNATAPKRRISVVWGGSRGNKLRHGTIERSIAANRQRRHSAGHAPSCVVTKARY